LVRHWGCGTATSKPRLGWCRWCRGSMRIGLEPRRRSAGAGARLYADYLHGEYGELDSDYVFVNLWSGPIGCPLTYASVYDLVSRLRERTGIIFGPHTFRHSYATELLRRKVPVEVVQHLLGHASIATTSDAYAHLKVEDARRALVAAGWLAERDGSQ
jgi:integrase/recombinase XerD